VISYSPPRTFEYDIINILKAEGFVDIRLCTGWSPEKVKKNLNLVKCYPKSPPDFENITDILY
jgi:hypothetical protein